MNFEPKVTDQAAFVAIWHNVELLVLQSRKWQTEGTPYLLPGGGYAKEDEGRSKVCARRELREETLINVPYDKFEHFGIHKTQWSNCTFFEVFSVANNVELRLEEKFYGYEWWNFETDKRRIEALQPFMMPGLRWYLEQKGLL